VNKERRSTIKRALEQIGDARATIETATEEERDYYDNMPESIRDGSKGDEVLDTITAMETAITELEEAEAVLEEFLE